ncbi:hypothetical protein WKT22_00658 [Candidatus Lokiarchaeum ossiferum]
MIDMALTSLEPKLVWQIFEEVFNSTPRESKKEGKIRKKIVQWVSERAKIEGVNLQITEDAIGNILVKKPATSGMENVPALLMQGHMDMVCETDKIEGFDFDTMPITAQIQSNGEWVEADHTTLGADNGIALSIALAFMFDKNPDIEHGPLELLITVDEETGLTGAFNLDVEALGITSKLLMNIDSEDLGAITIGSAGGGDMIFRKNIEKFRSDEIQGLKFFELKIAGLFGGHSGVDIALPRANANKLVARCMSAIIGDFNVYIALWNGGSKRNAITRESKIVFAMSEDQSDEMVHMLNNEKEAILKYYLPYEPKLVINLKESAPFSLLSNSDSSDLIHLMNLIPSGPLQFSPSIQGLVETSNNLAVISTTESEVSIQISARSSVDADLIAFRRTMAQLAYLLNWQVDIPKSYPGWKPEPNNPFLKFVTQNYQDILNKEIVVEAIHAGLECGVIGAKIPGIQMVSLGPTVENPHTPEERVNIKSVGLMYKFIKLVCANLKNFA